MPSRSIIFIQQFQFGKACRREVLNCNPRCVDGEESSVDEVSEFPCPDESPFEALDHSDGSLLLIPDLILLTIHRAGSKDVE